nr:restriction endonuclease subunit S [Phocaeicola dorei]
MDINKTDCVGNDIIQGISSKFKVHTGDILIAMTGAEIGKLGIIPSTNKDLWLNQRVGMLVERYPGAKYIAYLQLRSDYGLDYVENTATGSAQPNISSSAIENCGFPLLDVSEIKALAYQLEGLYEKIIHNLGHINGLKLLRNELLLKLMNSQV